MKKALSLYLHFPFCVRKCLYCDFLSFPGHDESIKVYLKRLLQEIEWQADRYRDYEVQTIFIGGGTPSLMSGQQLQMIMDALFHYFDISKYAEITIECNPGTVNADKLHAYKQTGINRISFGVQSLNDDELSYIGRIHSASDAVSNYIAARNAGFDNINIDLMSALPGQTEEDYLYSLHKVLAMEPEHISAYSLIIEEGTPFGNWYLNQESKGMRLLPDEDTERRMYHRTKEELEKHGYPRYEISNYAKKGYECRHNLVYWHRGDYLGLGLGASGMIADTRYRHSSEMAEYMQTFQYEEIEHLSQKSQIEETMFLGLRCSEGVCGQVFKERFGCSLMEVYGSIIDRYNAQGMLWYDVDHDRVCLTDTGMDISNWILSDFLLE